MFFGPILVIGLAVFATWMLSQQRHMRPVMSAEDGAVSMLRERLVRGEIDRDEFERIARVLRA